VQADTHEITGLLLAWRRGDSSALDKLVPLVYRELRRLAHRYMQGERRGHTLQTTALIHEAYLRLVECRSVQWQDRAHFLAVGARMMRRILVEAARSRGSAKRGSGRSAEPLDDALSVYQARSGDLVALDDALTDLAAADPVKAHLVELRFFGGLAMAEAAVVLGLTEDAARWTWRLARAWLFRELCSGGRYAR